MTVMSQQELEARYAGAVSAKAACFVYAGHVDEVVARLGVGECDRFVDVVGGAGLRVPNVRALACEVHEHGGRLLVDNTVPSFFGCDVFGQGADVCLEALDRVAAGALERKVVAVSSCTVSPLEGDVLDERDSAAIDAGLSTMAVRMQAHFDHARALAEYLSCCECLTSVSHPGLSTHPDHNVAAGTLRHGFGPAVDFEFGPSAGVTARDFIEACRLNGRSHPAGGPHTRLSARDGNDGRAIRLFAGLDDPLMIAADLDQAMRRLFA